jgi:hypothetical protein
MLLADWERHQADLECQEVLEDPLAMAAALAQGQAIRGKVVKVEADHFEPSGSGKRMVARPILTLLLAEACPFPAGSELWWSLFPGSVKVQVIQTDPSGSGSCVVLKVIAGMTGTLPKVGDEPIFSVYTTSWVPPAALPPETPWTHVAEKDASDGLELDDAPPGDETLALGGAA